MARFPLIAGLLAALLSPALASASAVDRWEWPVGGDLLTVYRYGGSPYARRQHRGIDVAAPIGTPVTAAAPGTVRFVGIAGSSGLTVSIRTADGRFDTSYLHLSATTAREGERVDTGERIGAVGVSGTRSVAPPHLHFGVRAAGTRHGYRDPLELLPQLPRVRDTPHVGPAPRPVPALPFGRPASAPAHGPRPAPTPVDLGWAVACLALLLATALLGGVARSGATRTHRSSIGLRAVLRHNADLLRQR